MTPRRPLDIFLTFAIAGCLFPVADDASAAACFSRKDLAASLESRFGEVLVLQGVMTGGRVLMELFASEKTGAWSLVYTTPDGVTCPITSGEGLDMIPAKPKGTLL